jgi:hypothetical protein
MAEPLAFLEHRFGERAAELRARDRHRAHVVQPHGAADAVDEAHDVFSCRRR